MNVPNPQQPLPSKRQLLSATTLALCTAAVLLATVVLPAEYGIDPLGAGRQLGLTTLRESSGQTKAAPAPTVSSPAVTVRLQPYRTDELSVVLPPGKGAEIKATMKAGEQFVYSWTASGGPVDFDMHGEEPSAPAGEFTSYWKNEGRTGDSGAFVAPFNGIHGWYWENKNAQPVTVQVRTSGFYEKLAKQ